MTGQQLGQSVGWLVGRLVAALLMCSLHRPPTFHDDTFY